MKQIGEQGANAFSEVNKMSQSHTTDENHPVFGLKRDLIRLITNMTYKNRTNQDKVLLSLRVMLSKFCGEI